MPCALERSATQLMSSRLPAYVRFYFFSVKSDMNTCLESLIYRLCDGSDFAAIADNMDIALGCAVPQFIDESPALLHSDGEEYSVADNLAQVSGGHIFYHNTVVLNLDQRGSVFNGDFPVLKNRK